MGGGVHGVGFVDDEDFSTAESGGEAGGSDEEVSDDVDGEVAGDGVFGEADELAVDEVVVGVGATIHEKAGGAGVAGVDAEGGVGWGLAEEDAGEGEGGGAFTDAIGAGEEQCVGEATGGEGGAEDGDGGFLGEDGGEVGQASEYRKNQLTLWWVVSSRCFLR